MKTVLKINVTILKDGFKLKDRVYNIKNETPKFFVSDENDRINKDKIMKVDSMFITNVKFISFYIYCFLEDKDKAIEILKDHIISVFDDFEESYLIMKNHVDKLRKPFYCNDFETSKFGTTEKCKNQCDECKMCDN